MQMRFIASLFVIAVAVGWMMPDMAPSPMKTIGAPAMESANAPASREISRSARDDDEDDGWLSSEVSLEREPDGHFYADVAVNGQQLNFLVDTGATAVALTGSDAEALGLYWDDSELGVVGRGVSGNVYGKLVMLDNMQLGSLTVNNVPAAIIPEGLDRSLLGQAFLKKIDNVNIAGDRMVLR